MKVKFTDYNPEWVGLYNKEKELIIKVLGNIQYQIQHTGSTSIPGLGAKPCIDILLGIHSISELNKIIPALNSIGFEYRNFEDLVPGWSYFTKPGYCHVHCVELTSNFWRRQITFRDYLRTHDDVRDEYFRLKKELAQMEWDNPMDYNYAKTEFIKSIEEKAYEYLIYKIEIAEALAFNEMYSLIPEQFQSESKIRFENFGPSIFQTGLSKPNNIMNKTINFGIFEEADESFIDFMIDYYKTANSDEILLHLSYAAKPENISVLLLKKGFNLIGSMPKFYRDTFSVPEILSNFKIEEIDADRAHEFDEIVYPDMRNIFSHQIGKDNWHYYIAYHEDKAIAAACMFIYEETAWFGFATTVPEFRNNGAQSALIARRLIDAKQLGCKWISTETHDGKKTNPSYHNLTRLGFNLMYKRPIFAFKSH